MDVEMQEVEVLDSEEDVQIIENIEDPLKHPEKINQVSKGSLYSFGDDLDSKVALKKLLRITYEPHTCSLSCLRKNDHPDDDLQDHRAYFLSDNPFLKPIGRNFARCFVKNLSNRTYGIVYVAPCGVVLNTFRLIQWYLQVTGATSIEIDDFTFSKNFVIQSLIQELKVYNNDISHGREKLKVELVNAISTDFITLTGYISAPFYRLMTLNEISHLVARVNSCTNCNENCLRGCECSRETMFYKYKRLFFFNQETIYECSPQCECGVHCFNKVIMRGIKCKFQLFRVSNEKGWGVRATHFIPKGLFVVAYVGELMMNKHCINIQQDEYIATMGTFHTDDNGILQIERSDNLEDDSLLMNGVDYSNLARYINHSCNPNLFGQCAVIENGLNQLVPTFALFASRDINPFEELSWDYNYSMTEYCAIKCKCLAASCHSSLR